MRTNVNHSEELNVTPRQMAMDAELLAGVSELLAASSKVRQLLRRNHEELKKSAHGRLLLIGGNLLEGESGDL